MNTMEESRRLTASGNKGAGATSEANGTEAVKDGCAMGAHVAICDESALFYLMHQDVFHVADVKAETDEVLRNYSHAHGQLSAFNYSHPAFGGAPVSVLVPHRSCRAHNNRVKGCLCTTPIPEGSFFKLRDGLYVASPEFTFTRMAAHASEAALAEMGMNLCASYYVDAITSNILQRRQVLTTPESLDRYLASASGLRGQGKAQRALRWVVAGAASPMESKLFLQFCLPLRMGGFALPFTHLNFNVSDQRSAGICEQSYYCIDLAAPKLKVGLEYDGLDYHQDISGDRRRRNALRALGWEVFPVDKGILFNANATKVLAGQVARHLGIRLRWPTGWEERYARLRADLGLSKR